MLTIEVQSRNDGYYHASFTGTCLSVRAATMDRVLGKLGERAHKLSKSDAELCRTLATFIGMLERFMKDGHDVATMPHENLGALIRQQYRACGIALKILSPEPPLPTPNH